MTSSAFTPSVLTLPQMGVNKLINGNFDIWQRGTSAQTISGYGSDDRWYNENSGSTKSHSQQTFTIGQTDVPSNPKFYSRTVVTSVAGAGNYVVKAQRIESVATLSGQNATLSFYAKADASKNIAVEFLQSFGSGGSPSASVGAINVTTCALTTSWKRFIVPVTLPSVAGKTLGTNNNDFLNVAFWFDAGSSFNARTNSLGQQSGTFDIAQVQFEAGSSATAFEQRQIGYELALCQRYYESTYFRSNAPNYMANSASDAILKSHVPYKVTKRGNGTVNVKPSGGSVGQIHRQYLNAAGSNVNATVFDAFADGFNIKETAAAISPWSATFIFLYECDAEL